MIELIAALGILAPGDSAIFVRVNQLGYLPEAGKTAVVCALADVPLPPWKVIDAAGRTVRGPERVAASGPFGPCVMTWRLDFSALRRPGRYRIIAGTDSSAEFRIGDSVYDGAADTLLYYMRQQRSGWNPLFAESVHTKDGIIVDHPTRAGEFIPVSGGWADASDYLQYVTTSATATTAMMIAWRDHPAAFADGFNADGRPGANGVPDVLDEARHGLAWLLRMHPDDSTLFNQLGDDRDHRYLDLPPTDSSDYGWGKGGYRPVYPCTGRPQGLLRHLNRSSGLASTAGKFAAAFALGARLWRERDPAFADTLASKARTAWAAGEAHPGVCQTAPAGAPYFYEEDNWTDDMELAAAELFELTGDDAYQRRGLELAAMEPVTPWLGADTAAHYQWFPWHNVGHHELWRGAGAAARASLAGYYRDGLERVARRADNGFRVGIPFIWCSNNLMASFATQAMLYRRMTGDGRFREYEAAAIDWLFGVNPWGVSMVIGLPHSGRFARDPHSVIAKRMGVELTGGLLDGPVYRSIFANLRGIRLIEPDEYARFNTGFIVFHDDFGDYSTNEPIMDGTANLAWVLAALASNRSP